MSANVTLPEDIYRRVESRVEDSDFESVDAYVTFVLEEVTREHPELETDTEADDERDDDIRENLRSLGYLE